jgi:hypothetical protein
MRRTKAAEVSRKTGNLRAVQLLLGHAKVDSTVRYLGVELEDALERAFVLANLDLFWGMGGLRNEARVINVVFSTLSDYVKYTKVAVLCGIGVSACQSGPQPFIMKIQLSRPVAGI